MSRAMAKDDPKREARLAEALRQNLRRRKAQEREIDPAPPSSTPASTQSKT